VQRIKKLFDRGDLLARSDASEQHVEELRRAGKLTGYRYLHFATHGQGENDRAFESFLVLAQDKLPRFEGKPGVKLYDGELSAGEVLRDWALDADLVTLSACESAFGKSGRGEGMLGFTHAFLLAGARTVCLSLWKVDDKATMILMVRFYENLLGKRAGLAGPMPKASALREAKEWLRNLTADEVLALSVGMRKGISRGTGETPPPELQAETVAPAGNLKVKPYADPRYWAAFILVGDPD
jgi:CHAT domain-containing protein